MVISHDRWFLDRIATHILAAEGDRKWVFFNGNYQEYEADKEAPGRRRRAAAPAALQGAQIAPLPASGIAPEAASVTPVAPSAIGAVPRCKCALRRAQPLPHNPSPASPKPQAADASPLSVYGSLWYTRFHAQDPRATASIRHPGHVGARRRRLRDHAGWWHRAAAPRRPPRPAAPDGGGRAGRAARIGRRRAHAAGAPGQPQPFATVIKDAKKIDGVLTIWQKDDKVWIELMPEDFGKPMFFSPKIARGIGEAGLFGGSMIGPYGRYGRQQLVEFKRVHNLVQLLARNTEFTARDRHARGARRRGRLLAQPARARPRWRASRIRSARSC